MLVVGEDPTPYEVGVENQTSNSQPKGYNAAKNAILKAVKNGSLEGELIEVQEDINSSPEISLHSSTVIVEDLKLWLRRKGFEKHFFFFPEGLDGEFLDEDHPRYSPKLAAAVRAWEALEDDSFLKATTPKKAAQKWLRLYAVDFNLCDSDGIPVESAIEEISKVVNWNPKGGAPSTPDAQELSKKSTKAGRLSVNKPEAAEKADVPPPPFEDGIPF